ncbi:hypothetical protein LTS18_004885, partial [Coniosporium uncinatum]
SSIFESAFPEASKSDIRTLESRTQMCAIQVNGKLKFAVKIPVPSAAILEQGSDVAKDFVIGQIKETDEGRNLLVEEGTIGGKTIKKVIVVKGGKTVNFVVK